jgi:hypothetical protein
MDGFVTHSEYCHKRLCASQFGLFGSLSIFVLATPPLYGFICNVVLNSNRSIFRKSPFTEKGLATYIANSGLLNPKKKVARARRCLLISVKLSVSTHFSLFLSNAADFIGYSNLEHAGLFSAAKCTRVFQLEHSCAHSTFKTGGRVSERLKAIPGAAFPN